MERAQTTIRLSARNHSDIADHGERDYPHECCGLLIGRFANDGGKIVSEVYPISNAREEEVKRNRFLIRPEELIKGEHYAVRRGQEVVGFYHSHPDHPDMPSAYDLDHAWPLYSYVIISVHNNRANALRSWQLENDRTGFNEEVVLKGS